MLPWHALSRVLLALLLLLNVAGTAAAAAMHAAGAHATTQHLAAEPAACHDTGAGEADHGTPATPEPDCCNDGSCTACTGLAHVLPPPALPAAGTWPADDLRAAPDSDHAGTMPAQPVRPPIG